MTEQLLEKLNELTAILALQHSATRDILTLGEAAHFMGISKSQLYKLTSTRQIPYYCPNGKKTYFLKADLTEWMLRHRKSTVEEIQKAALASALPRIR